MVVSSTRHYLSRIYSVDDALPAIVIGERTLTYSDLKDRSLRVAGALRARGVTVGSKVAVELDRGPDLIVSLLGILAAGACYIPIDRSYPAARLAFMRAAADPVVLITDRSAAATDQAALEQLSPAELIAAGPALPAALPRAAEDPTYVIFTSGSTGQPKGVIMPDGALANLLDWQWRQADAGAATRTLQFTPAGFDVHFQEIFHTLACGGALVLLSDAERRDAQQLLALIDEQRVTNLYMPYVALAALAEAAAGRQRFPMALRSVVTAGEQLVITPAIRTFFTELPEARLHNQYGPSETHVVTAHTLLGPASAWPELPPIGHPIDGVDIEIVNAALEPVAPGEAGELLLSGVCLASGYLDAEQTAQRFLSRPYGRAYRTGDLVRADAAGLEYLGRTDRQLKIRGHRVEPGEIEAAILAHPEIDACVVGSAGSESTTRSLVAYLVPAPLKQINDATLAAWEQVWDSTYDLPGVSTDPTFDTRGWNSSYGGAPLPAAEMRAWVAETSRRIEALKPKRVLELGAGTGLIMYGLRNRFEYYCASDYSATAVEHLRQGLAANPELVPQVSVARLAAHEAATLKDQQFDTVVINSLTQHFGSLAYLERVIEGAVEALAGQGQIFLGDVTALNTRSLYFASVALFDRPDLSNDDLLTEVARRAGAERELVIDPAYFYRLIDQLPAVSDVRIQLKGADYDNELSRFRYDVVLTVGGMAQPSVSKRQLVAEPWRDVAAAQEAVARLPEDTTLWLRGVPHQRLTDLSQRLESACEAGSGAPGAVAPGQNPLDLAQRLVGDQPLLVDTFFSESQGSFDVLVRPTKVQATTAGNAFAERHDDRSVLSYASTPLDLDRFADLKEQLRAELKTRFPDYLVPQRFVPLAKLPTTASGKIDRARLPQPSSARPDTGTPFVAPRNPVEQSIARAWCQVLELDAVGVDDNFFDIGGNSSLSLRLVTAMSRELAQPVPIVALFQHPTIAELAVAYADGAAAAETGRSNQRLQQDRARAQREALARQRTRHKRRGGGRV